MAPVIAGFVFGSFRCLPSSPGRTLTDQLPFDAQLLEDRFPDRLHLHVGLLHYEVGSPSSPFLLFLSLLTRGGSLPERALICSESSGPTH